MHFNKSINYLCQDGSKKGIADYKYKKQSRDKKKKIANAFTNYSGINNSLYGC